MATAKRLTKAQKANLAESETKALAGHHQAVTAPTNKGQVSDEQAKLTAEFEDQVKGVLRSILAGAVATITGDLQRGYLRDRFNNDHQAAIVKALADAGLVSTRTKPEHANGLYHLVVTKAGRDYLDE